MSEGRVELREDVLTEGDKYGHFWVHKVPASVEEMPTEPLRKNYTCMLCFVEQDAPEAQEVCLNGDMSFFRHFAADSLYSVLADALMELMPGNPEKTECLRLLLSSMESKNRSLG